MLLIPELDFEVQSGTLGGCFTTVEGLLVQARDQLMNAHPFLLGDSASEGSEKAKLQAFAEHMNEVSSKVSVNSYHVLWCVHVDY